MRAMSKTPFDSAPLGPLQKALAEHPVYQSVRGIDHLRCFMGHHIYPVWDFMSLLKYLQHTLAPAAWPWQPSVNPSLSRLVNEIVCGEESDECLPDASGRKVYASHFDIYLNAMREVGADTVRPLQFFEQVRGRGLDSALSAHIAPTPCVEFMRATFGFIATGKPHVVAAAFALGREEIVPAMFCTLLERMGIGAGEAPAFHYYLQRHLHLDQEIHGPLAMEMLTVLCAGDAVKLREAQEAATAALQARIRFWDAVEAAIRKGAAH